MNTKTKSTIGACVLAVAGVLVAVYVPEGQRESALTGIGLLVGWLGFRQPGTEPSGPKAAK